MVTPIDNSQSRKHDQDVNPMFVAKVVDLSPMELRSLTSTAGPRLLTADVRRTSMICGKAWTSHAGRGRGLAGDWIGERRMRGR